MKKIFIIESEMTQHEFELIHRYIRKTLDKNNVNFEIKSMDLNTEMERLIFGVHVY